MADQTDREELIKLRVGIARVAQALGLEDSIPGQAERPGQVNHQSLRNAAVSLERGWHDLCSIIIGRVEEAQKASADVDRLLGKSSR